MKRSKLKTIRRVRRRGGIRKRVFGTPEQPRLAVFRSGKNIGAQIIDDVAGKTLAAASSLNMDKGWDVNAAADVGKVLAENAKAAGVSKVSFDRGGHKYHGRIKALADGARKGGLKF